MKGRKRHLLVDTNGLMLQVLVHSASVQERAGARRLLQKVGFDACRMELIWADSDYWGAPFAEWVQKNRG